MAYRWCKLGGIYQTRSVSAKGATSIKIINGQKEIEIIPTKHGQVILTFHNGKIVMIEESKKTQIK
jgi:hypothetical protein